MTNPKQCPTCGSGDPQKAGPPCSLPGNAPDAFHDIPLEVAEWDRDGRLLRRNYDIPASEPTPSEDDPDGSEWSPVEILPRTPNTATARLHHRHDGVACAACYILALLAESDAFADAPETPPEGWEQYKAYYRRYGYLDKDDNWLGRRVPIVPETPTGAAREPSDDEPIPGVPESFWRWLEGDSITRVESDARVAKAVSNLGSVGVDPKDSYTDSDMVEAYHRGILHGKSQLLKDAVAEAELRLGRAWHSMALNTIRNAMTDPDEPEVISPFDTEAREIIRGMVAKGIRDQMEADAKMARRSNND